jgi:DNA-binding MarR family transcriptional regulator
MVPTPATAQALLDALTGRPGATAADLADAAGIGRSTAGKLLTKLAAEGGVLRQPGGRQGGRPSADRWTLLASTPAAATQDRSTASPAPTAEAGDPEQSRRESGRLGAGELRRLVLACLADHPGQALSPTVIAKALGRSAGAVSNALTVLAGQGAVVQTQVKPRRYTLAQQTDQAGVTG